MRPPVYAAAAILILGLFCGRSDARPLWLPTIPNPYCSVTTYTYPDLPEEAFSSIDASHQPLIVVSAMELSQNLPYAHFLMAHECCHHTLGHVAKYHQELGHIGVQPFYYIAPALRQMELDADCCAVKMLKSTNELDSIEAAKQKMAAFGGKPTGAYYPTGAERVKNIEDCAAKG